LVSGSTNRSAVDVVASVPTDGATDQVMGIAVERSPSAVPPVNVQFGAVPLTSSANMTNLPGAARSRNPALM
jgi:hypothetical protein